MTAFTRTVAIYQVAWSLPVRKMVADKHFKDFFLLFALKKVSYKIWTFDRPLVLIQLHHIHDYPSPNAKRYIKYKKIFDYVFF